MQLIKGLFAGAKVGQYLPEINNPEFRSNPSKPWFDGVDFAVQVGQQYTPENIFYPVRNIDFRNWQMQARKPKQRGGNVLIFSDLKQIQLSTPIVIPIGEHH
jgi:hypothetical protein